MGKSEKYMNTVKIGPKGQIVIPKEVRDMFALSPGDQLLLLADSNRGILLDKMTNFSKIADSIFKGKGGEVTPHLAPDEAEAFAENIRKAEKGEETIINEDSDKN